MYFLHGQYDISYKIKEFHSFGSEMWLGVKMEARESERRGKGKEESALLRCAKFFFAID